MTRWRSSPAALARRNPGSAGARGARAGGCLRSAPPTPGSRRARRRSAPPRPAGSTAASSSRARAASSRPRPGSRSGGRSSARGARQRHRSEPARGDRASSRAPGARTRSNGERGRPDADLGRRREAPAAPARERPSQPALTRRIDRAEARGAFTTAHQLSPLARALRRALPSCDVAAGDGAISPSGASRTRPRRSRRRRVPPRDRPSRSRGALVRRRGPRRTRSSTSAPRPTCTARAWRPARARWRLLLEGARGEARLRLYRSDRAALAFEARQQSRKNSAEEVLHPAYRTPRFASPKAIAACVAAARAARDPARRAPDAHRDRRFLRRPGAQARPLAAALPRAAPGDARRAALHRRSASTSCRAPASR